MDIPEQPKACLNDFVL
jgi:serine/threonine protein kinase